MKLNIFILVFASFFQITTTQAQNAGKQYGRADIEAQKVAFITSELKLTPKEAQDFWPLYNAYRSDLQKLRKSGKMGHSERSKSDHVLSDKELDEQMKKEFASDRQKIDLDERYYELFKTALPISKVAAYYQAERDFKRELLKALKERRD